MAEHRKHVRAFESGVLVLVLAVALAACQPNGGSKESAHRGSVDAATQREVVSALQEAGVQPAGGGQDLLMRWEQGKTDTIIVTGRFASQSASSTTDRGVYEVQKRADGGWIVRPKK